LSAFANTAFLMAPAAAFGIAAAVTPLVREVARRCGAVAVPKSDRWHSKPTAMFGGVAIYIAVIAAIVLFLPNNRDTRVVIVASSAMFLLGFIDDLLQIKPYQKLIGQLLASSAIVYFGLVLPWTGSFVINMLITFFWLVGITNAINMLDNMDGLAAGVSAIAAVFLAINFGLNGQLGEAMMLVIFAAVLFGFLIYNHNPASIFMGDCGSMFVGFFLASTALLSAQGGGGRSRSVVAVLAVPVLVLCIPIFDTTFVTVMRKLAGRSASQGGRDHTSHRLVALGLSERHAVWMLYGFASLAGVLALLVRHVELDVSLAAIACFSVVMALLGVYLAKVRVYDEAEVSAAQQKPLVSFLLDLSYKRRIFEVALDLVFIVLAQYAAYAFLFGPANAASPGWQLFLKTLPAIVAVKLLTFLAVGMYRGMWRYASLSDGVLFAKAVALSSVLSVLLVVFAFRSDGLSRTAFVLDGLILLVLCSGSRFAFRVLRKILPAPHARTGKRVLIFGAGDGGELTFRELLNNSELQCLPVAFVDDDPMKSGKVLHGLPVFAGDRSLAEICNITRADEVFLSTVKIPISRLRSLVEECQSAGVPVKRLSVKIVQIADKEVGWALPTTEPAGSLGTVPVTGSMLQPLPATGKSDVGH